VSKAIPYGGKLRAVARSEITYRRLVAEVLARIGEIDRIERIESLYVQHGTRLEERAGDWSAPAWFSEGEGEHSVAHQRAECDRHLAAGAFALGAFAAGRLVGIGVVTPHIRPGVAQFAFLYVSNAYRASGIGGHLSAELERVAGQHGDTAMVVSATPSLNTVRFYLGRGFEPMSEPLPEPLPALYELEPEDVHMQKQL
jgi:GNAT superfamily N-acetyltransferase